MKGGKFQDFFFRNVDKFSLLMYIFLTLNAFFSIFLGIRVYIAACYCEMTMPISRCTSIFANYLRAHLVSAFRTVYARTRSYPLCPNCSLQSSLNQFHEQTGTSSGRMYLPPFIWIGHVSKNQNGQIDFVTYTSTVCICMTGLHGFTFETAAISLSLRIYHLN